MIHHACKFIKRRDKSLARWGEGTDFAGEGVHGDVHFFAAAGGGVKRGDEP